MTLAEPPLDVESDVGGKPHGKCWSKHSFIHPVTHSPIH